MFNNSSAILTFLAINEVTELSPINLTSFAGYWCLLQLRIFLIPNLLPPSKTTSQWYLLKISDISKMQLSGKINGLLVLSTEFTDTATKTFEFCRIIGPPADIE